MSGYVKTLKKEVKTKPINLFCSIKAMKKYWKNIKLFGLRFKT